MRTRLPPATLLLLLTVGGSSASAQEKPPRPFETLLQDLGSKFGKTREQAARELAGMGTDASRAVPDLIKVLSDAYEPARVWAAVALSRIDPKEKSGVPVLLKAVATKREELPLAAAKALGAYDAGTPGVVEALVGLLGDPGLRDVAVGALVAKGEAVVPSLLKALEPADPLNGPQVLRIVQGLGTAGIPAALSLLDHPHRGLRRSMARWLAKDMEGAYPPPVHFLLADLAEPGASVEKVKAAEEKALAAGAEAVPGLAGLLGTSQEPRVHLRVTRVLLLMGPVARAAVPALRSEALEFGKGLRESALLALAAIDPQAATRPLRAWAFPESGFFSLRPREGSPDRPRGGASARIDEPVEQALEWLARHQSPDGTWECAGFEKRCRKPCGGPGLKAFDVGVTGLAVLAFLGAGVTPASPRHGETVRKGIEALIARQDKEGCIGGNPGNGDWIIGHAVGTMALAEAHAVTGSLVLGRRAQDAVNFVLQCQNPYLGWSYGVRPQSNDTATTGWMMLALRVAKEAGLDIDPAAFDGGKAWCDKVTEPEYGRAGYTSRDSPPPRYKGWTDYKQFPQDWFEGTTAIAILSRIVAGADADDEFVNKGFSLVLRPPPKDDPRTKARDFHFMHFAALAAFQRGGDTWQVCWSSVRGALLYDQVMDKEDDRLGSWEPVDPWSHGGGRIYATAINCLTLETPYRYGRFTR